MRLFNSRRGEAEFGAEQFVRLVMSFAIATIMLGMIVIIVAMFVGGKADKTAGNSLDNLVWLIKAQKSDEWKVSTIVPLFKEYMLVGFSEGTPQVSVFARPSLCKNSCICVYEIETVTVDDEPSLKSNKALECKTIPYTISDGLTEFAPGSSAQSRGFAFRTTLEDSTGCDLVIIEAKDGALKVERPACSQRVISSDD